MLRSTASPLCSNLFSSKLPSIFTSSNLFSSKLPSIFTRNETFCEHKGLLKVFGTVRFTGDFQLKNFSKNDFFKFFVFFLMFSVEKDGFFDVSSWRRMVFEIYAYPFGYFLAL